MNHLVSDYAPAFNPGSQRLENWAALDAPRDISAHPRILVADDNQSIRAMLRDALRNRGFSVLLAADGEEALELYGLNQNTINLLLMDVHMPALDGPESLRVLRDFDPDVACCFMSGGLGRYSMEDLESLTPLPFFEKPLRVIEMVEMLWNVAHHQNPSANEQQRHRGLNGLSEQRSSAQPMPIC